ncbi:MAG: hypothetical protein A2168_06695 [Planctomycetes bacterium RBG_13_50_24]|nr:MAG: hypothetical protein A2168_06695 [Planctomycetes bacterium RBG_13_50_24]
MTTIQVMTTLFKVLLSGIPALLHESLALALTPQERWRAAGGSFDNGFITEHWFILSAAVVGIILSLLLLVVSHNRITKHRSGTNQLFTEYAGRSGLNTWERHLLFSIAAKAGLKQSEEIFTLSGAFERGAVIIVDESVAAGQTPAQIEQLRAQLFFLREKLGFQKRAPASIGSSTRPKRLASRQIPVGKKIYLVHRSGHPSDTIESTVTENNEAGLAVKPAKPIKIVFGEVWYARYYFGASVWEFDTSVISYNGDILVLNQSDDLRFVNRRRFLRVPVYKPAFIAHFPFIRTSAASGHKSMKSFRIYRSSTAPSGEMWGLPEFVPAVVTELAGPGLCIEAPLELKVDDRVLVVFKLDEENIAVRPEGSRQAEDIGVVRHIKALPEGFSIAIELTGLSDPDVSELIRVTNAASLKMRHENAPVSQNVKEGDVKPAVAQRV